MAITDELRGWWVRTFPVMDKELHEEFTAIAHNIDAEHERATSEFWQKVNAVPATDENMAEYGWVRLPVDADGVPIRFGDKVTVSWNKRVYKVKGFSYTQQLAGGERTVWVDVYSLEKPGNVPLCAASSCRHYHAPTVEDTLHELIGKALMLSEVDGENELVAEYAKRLTLRGDGE